MSRGILNFLIEDRAYGSSNKEWIIELQQTQMYWYELLVNPHDQVDTRKHISEQVKFLKKEVESCLEKRFIYFICSRKKVRFCSKTPPVPTPYHGFMKIRVLVGREKKSQEFVAHALYDENDQFVMPEIDSTGRFIVFPHPSGYKQIFSIHDYLLEFGINLGFSTKVEYVGKTKNPNNRPLNRVHGGLNDVLYNVSNEDNDIIIYFNLFKVTSRATGNKYNIKYNVANSMMDEVKVEQEGDIIEKSFRFYFNPDTQDKNKDKERREIFNDLKEISKFNKINKIHILFEVDDKSEYYKFYSSTVTPKHAHCLTVELNDNDINIKDLNCSIEDFIESNNNN
ncbi:hypothetical protein Q3O60_17475 [Alkalimonas collagenimarina]|uniref:Uncharacterized protein n=1 Tax=Alkalimonas collagenimarina TaxID=400390 RepID=A0ABT9H3R5_9GAMM|nr:hypothetical protein [Alkalimonas collagenimarina]MDP4537974.1 hypothetical protein [Alkalimonas collagenimarina]